MACKALFLGSIGVVAETSELQRAAFNQAFERHGLDWHWSPEVYFALLEQQGGRARIASYAMKAGVRVNATAVYATKQQIFAAAMAARPKILRPGVLDIMAAARTAGIMRAFVTSTTRAQVDAVLGGALTAEEFDYVGDVARVSAPKPAPDIYLDALATLGVEPRDVLAVEDTPESARAALDAVLKVVGFPGAAARDRAFPAGTPVVEFLSPALLIGPAAQIAAE